MDGTGRVLELPAELVKGRAVAVVAADVAHQRDELPKGDLVDTPAVLLQARAGALPEPVQRPARSGDADDRHVEVPAPDHRLKGGEDLFVREVARRAKE